MAGSGLMTKKAGVIPHLAQTHGVAKEVADLRSDLLAELAPMAAIAVEEWTNPAAKDDDAILLSKDTLSATAVTYSGSGLDGAVGGGTMSPPRNIIVTTAGTDADFAPNKTIVVNGVDVNGNTISENFVITAAGNPGVFTGAKAFAKVTSIVVPALGTHTDASFKVGFGDIIGFSKKLKTRAGLATLIMEIEAGVKVTTGTIADATVGLPNGTYLAANAPDGARDYAVYLEWDPTA